MKTILSLLLTSVMIMICLSVDAENMEHCQILLESAEFSEKDSMNRSSTIPKDTIDAYKKSFSCFKDITREDPSSEKAWQGRMECSKFLSKNDISFEGERDYSSAYYHYLNGEKELAFKNITDFLSNNSSYSDAWRLKGDIEDTFDDYRKLEANYSRAYYYKLSNSNNNYARDNITKFLSLNDSYKDAWRLSADIFNNSSDERGKSLTNYSLAYYYAPPDIDNLSNITPVDLNKPLDIINKSLNSSENHIEAWILKGNILYKKFPNNTEFAILAFKNATQMDKSSNMLNRLWWTCSA